MTSYWPWWAGAVGLALVTVYYALATDRSFGVSSAWDRVVHWRRERRMERLDEEFADDRALVEALAAATAEHFGTAPSPAPSPAPHVPYGQPGTLQVDEADVEPPVSDPSAATSRRPAPLFTQAALLISVFVGGLIAAVTSGRFELRLDMGPGFRDLVTADPLLMTVLLFVGGVLVGFGTRLAGGCSSGHGLNGCGRLSPVSIVATAVFFGTAVAVSFLLWKVI
ncbi:YeeE/YedE family protein [Streptomyces sp. NPDC056600]|uniref:YeeE/YedE family protein n=1 Tax=Streptomyces sp. NPDC056600 TaxID=3345874 RepID=UPI0036BBC5ED